MDASFALRGIVNSTGSRGKNARQLPLSIELITPTEERLVNKLVSRSCRAFHASRAASESAAAKAVPLNRPLSPHLPLKKPQISATYSISHRILGVGVAGAVLLFPLAMKFSILFDI